MSVLKKLAGQTAIYGLPTIIGRLLNYLLVPLYTINNFSRAEYGTVNEMYAYVSFFNIILTYGMETALFNFSVKFPDKNRVYSTILLSVTATSVLFVAAMLLGSNPLASLIGYPQHAEYVVWFALILGADAVAAIAFAMLREQNRAKTFAAVKMVNILINIGCNVFIFLLCKPAYENPENPLHTFAGSIYNPEIGVGYVFLSNLAASTVTLVILLPFMLKIKPVYDFSLLKSIVPYSLPLLVAGLAGMTNETLDRILLKYLLPENIALEQVGIYGACYKLSLIMTIFIQTFRYAAEPFFFAHSVEGNARKTYARVMNYFVIVCMFIFLATMFNIGWLKYFIGKNFWEGLRVVPILLLANFCLGVVFNLSIWYKLTGKTRSGAYITIAGAVITIALNVALIPTMGYVGSAWATLACYAFMMTASYITGQRHFTVPYELNKIFTYVAAALVLYALSVFAESRLPGGAALFGVNLALLMVYAAGVWFSEKKAFHAA